MDNLQFYADHLRSNSDQQRVTPQQEILSLAEVHSECQPAVREAFNVGEARTGEAEEEQLELTEAVNKMKA